MPVVHLIVGPNGAGKTTFHERILKPALRLPFINADVIARSLWPGREEEHGYAAAAKAERERSRALAAGRSFIAETVFSHPSKLEFLRRARKSGYQVTLHVILIPEDLAVVRVRLRREQGGHSVPEAKVRSRYRRLWLHVRNAIPIVDEAVLYDNSRAKTPFRLITRYRDGIPVLTRQHPGWSPLR